jgi:hypothetical protein
VREALRPVVEVVGGEPTVPVWPAQPVAGRMLTVGAREQRVPDADVVSLDLGSAVVERPVHRLLGAEDFELTAHAETLAEIAEETGGRSADMVNVSEVLGDLKAEPRLQSTVTNYALWKGAWPLAVVLLLVSAEYLLRRRAGRVM